MRLNRPSRLVGRRFAVAAVPALCLGAGALETAHGAAYRVREIAAPSVGGVQSVDGLNSLGTVAVSFFGPDRAGTWNNAVKGLLDPVNSDPSTVAGAINDRGVVVGYSSDNVDFSPLRWDTVTGAAVELPTFGIRFGMASDINDRGDIVGSMIVEPSFGDAFTRAVLWPVEGGVIRFPTLLGPDVPGVFSGEFSEGFAINNRGDIAGISRGDGGTKGFYRPAGADSEMIDVSTLGAVFSSAEDLNDFGEVVGNSRTAGGTVDLPFRWRADTGTMVSLGTLRDVGAFALGINNRGQVVGYDVDTGPGGTDRAFLVNPGGTITDLNTLLPAGSEWLLKRATAINNAGVIVGLGRFQNQDRAFILTPDSPAVFVPCFADLNRDLTVNTVDLVQFLGEFGRTVLPGAGADVNGDGAVNTSDLAFLLGAFGRACT